MASEFEEELKALDEKLEIAQKSAEGLVNGLKRARGAAGEGNVSEIAKSLSSLDARLAEVQLAAGNLSDAWGFDVAAYMADGRFLADLQAAAAGQNLELFERDGRVYCFPLIVRIEPSQSAVRIGRKVERAIRPNELVRLLGKAQKRPQRFREQAFLDLIWRVYRRLVGREWSGADLGRVIALNDIHETLTLLPGSDYPAEEFARDLLLLDRRPDLRARGGERFEFPRGTTTKGMRGERPGAPMRRSICRISNRRAPISARPPRARNVHGMWLSLTKPKGSRTRNPASPRRLNRSKGRAPGR